ncbi:TonB-dependent receptor [candidate division WOR-3 bacterium]|nr:TonB-dependent receptor [candidate division WOR-3 bacterium]
MSRKWIIVAIGLVVLIPAVILAEDFGRIIGVVIDKNTKEPLPMVNIIVKGTSLGAAAGMNGRYIIANIAPGNYKVMATMMGYRTVTKEIRVFPGETSHLNFEIIESSIELGGLVVTGTKTPRYIKDIPVRTEVITAQTLEEKAATNLYEALEGLPGIRVEQQCSYCNFSIIRMQGLEPGHVQVLIDGQPIYSGLASVYGLQQVPTGSIDRIEIVKGAGSALYGSSAIAGVINIITKKPSIEPSVEASVNIGSHATNEFSLSASRKFGDLDALVFAQKNTGNEIDENNDGVTDRVKTDNVSIGTRINVYSLVGDDQLTISGRSLNEQRQGGELETWENPFAAGTENIRTTRYEAGINYVSVFQNGGKFGFNIFYTLHKRNATNDGFLGDYMDTHGDTVPPVDEMEPYLADENLYVLDANYSHPIGRHRLLGGILYSYNELNESGRYVIVDEDDPDYGGTYTSESEKNANDVGIYLQGEFPVVSEVLELVIGGRYDMHHSEDNFGGSGKVAPKERIELEYTENSINPRVALMYRVSSQFAFRTSVGTGFRVPYGFSEDLHLCSGSPRVNKPAGLKPEKSVSINLGADCTADRFGVNVSVFRTNLEDIIGFEDANDESKQLGYTYEWANLGKGYTQGVELGSRLLILDDFDVDINLTYTDAQYEEYRSDWVDHAVHENLYAEDSKYIPRVPKITGGVSFGFTPADWNFGIGVDYTGRMYIDYLKDDDVEDPGSYIKHTDPFYILNARVAKSFPIYGINIFVGSKNIFNYVQPEKHPDDAAFMYAPYTGRIVYSGIEVKI